MPAPRHKHRKESSSAGRPRDRKPAATSTEVIRIESLAAGGAGIAKLNGGAVVFVPGAAPGDVLEAEIQTSARPLRGRLVRLLEPRPERVSPPCVFAASCGGCDWMHLSTSAQE